ncbi:N-acetylmuramoyl-L-alanine amidase [Hazenella sp. IB182357]|uniref:N-acetylmuramoyl-L-alanine amidase n=1 Tax=Polycladospora coralii TaxID=2771432 RepID=A0A926NB23_9BACL|nr:N-acetylmuramoyl-L-alanine amidase [Polycladospora coralii]MBD1373267.1 N-acetylmuramoyl-L-alanine amidase [Polycladospora coralii]
MTWQYGKHFQRAQSFINWLQGKQTAHITEVHVHHTFKPSHQNFNGRNHLALQNGMRRYHLNKGWRDIAQHITIFPDGHIVTGRNINVPPASATGWNDSDQDNRHPFMFEMIGNFDMGFDRLEGKQLETAIHITKYFYNKKAGIRFHNQLLINGKSPKSCPGTSIGYQWFVGLVKGFTPTIPNTTIPNYSSPKKPLMQFLKLTNPYTKNDSVKAVQQRLGVRVDGVYGPITAKAVIQFQNAFGIVVDGVVGPQTLKVLNQPPYRGIMRRGSRGQLVKVIQLKIGRLVVDGIYGLKTEARVEQFQRKHKLAIDGVIGKNTWNQIFLN